MDDKLPRKDASRGELPEPGQFPSRRQVRIEIKGPLGCLVGAVILAAALATLLVTAFAGLIAIAVAFWIGAAFVAIAIIAALIRGRLR